MDARAKGAPGPVGRRRLLLSRGNASVFATRPISAVLLVAAILLVLIITVPNIRRQREEAFQEA